MARIVIAIGLLVVILFVFFAYRGADTATSTSEWLRSMRAQPAESFQRPQTGDRVKIQLRSGASREGTIHSIARDTVVIRTADGEVTYPKQSIAPGSRALLFESDFDDAELPDRPSAIENQDVVQQLIKEGGAAIPVRDGRVQYVIAGTNAIIIFSSPD